MRHSNCFLKFRFVTVQLEHSHALWINKCHFHFVTLRNTSIEMDGSENVIKVNLPASFISVRVFWRTFQAEVFPEKGRPTIMNP